jgi:hypothetical protein
MIHGVDLRVAHDSKYRDPDTHFSADRRIHCMVRRVDGSILTMQFGEPHLTMREAVSASRGSSGHSKIAPDPYPSELPKPDIPYILEL